MPPSNKTRRQALKKHKLISSGNEITQVSELHFKVKAPSSQTTYNVAWVADKWVCTCARFSKDLRACYHITAVLQNRRQWVRVNQTRGGI